MRRLILLALLIGACADDPDVVEPSLGGGAGDGIADVSFGSDIVLGTAVDGAFTRNGQFDGYALEVRAGARVKLEITHGGSSMGLDTTLFVYGPRDASGDYPGQRIAFDNDAGYGKLSKLAAVDLAEGGTYAVVVGTRTGKGRGRYRLVPTCLSGACGPLAAVPLGGCPAPIVSAMAACVTDQLEHPYVGLEPRMNAAEQCADADVLAPVYDAHCASGAPWCETSFEAFHGRYAAACTRDVKNQILDGFCVFGTTYREMAQQPALTLTRDLRLVATSLLTALERAQVIEALHASSHTDVTTVAQAFERVDSNEIFQRQWWDASGRRAFVSYEYGAGDNSYGRIFPIGSTTEAADITDGDILVCHAKHGREIRDCAATIDCHAGLTCVGTNTELRRGTCLDGAADTSSHEGDACSATTACPLADGLVCAGLTRAPEGLCLPGWQRRHFATTPDLAIPDNKPAGATATVHAYGLATVDMDVWLHVQLRHPRTADLVITLTNPAGATVPVFNGTAGVDLDLDVPVLGFSGDEQVNGAWTLTVVDKASTKTGVVDRIELTVGSRWD
ncbi:MAG: proprotein convertase P-domain-containing protein [Deltaproteobacteria bacterium]|nr:proprotein convertase P-domain-containing protein [Deltaproteobacteria bacterium]MDQ3300562.1 proprotein convertase P-domain-containing protein [Myxococcota bacterium]